MGHSTSSNPPARSRSTLFKGLIAVAIILGCTVWVAYLLVSNRPTVIAVDPTKPTTAWLAEFNAKSSEIYDQIEKVLVSASEDGRSVTISGSVKSAADLDRLKSVLEGLEPKLPLTWSVRVGR
ncbi:MAG: hypothetical protein K2Q09_00185 [Phycisphaerales bacterium]|nr:hypothetical protein [Phycisphaerales bacterium]